MADFKSMYYHLAGRMATAVEVLETSTKMQKALAEELAVLAEKLKHAQQATEEMFVSSDDDIEA